MHGHLIAFEGLDQSGKQTQAERLHARLGALGHRTELVSFPDYTTPIGIELATALRGGREYSPEVMQLLYIANRFEKKPDLTRMLAEGCLVVSDRFLSSSIAYGEAFGLDPTWLADIQRHLPRPSMTVLLDIAPETAVARKASDRDRYERDLALQKRVRESYRRLARQEGWLVLDGERSRDEVAEDVFRETTTRLALR